tara:strand:- start:5862 stop:6632 length:771 start_codon:yes stop_codon:yes gene_type:complete
MNLNNIVKFILNKIPEPPQSAIIIGSGLGDIISLLVNPIHIKYKNIIGHPHNNVPGHKSEWVFGYFNDQPIICANGRFHYYEGYSLDQISITVDIPHKLGCKKILISNSAGCLVKNWNVGDFMIINGYIDYTFRNSTNIPSTILCNNHFLIENKLSKIAKNIDINIRQGVYTWTLGPSYETPSEVDNIIALGGHAVGMSTIPEIIKAQELNIPILGVSCLTNYAAGLVEGHLTHHEVVSVASSIRKKFSQFINEVI